MTEKGDFIIQKHRKRLLTAKVQESDARWDIALTTIDILREVKIRMPEVTKERVLGAVGSLVNKSLGRIEVITAVAFVFKDVRAQYPTLDFGYYERAYIFYVTVKEEGFGFLEFAAADENGYFISVLATIYRTNILGEAVTDDPKVIEYSPEMPQPLYQNEAHENYDITPDGTVAATLEQIMEQLRVLEGVMIMHTSNPVARDKIRTGLELIREGYEMGQRVDETVVDKL